MSNQTKPKAWFYRLNRNLLFFCIRLKCPVKIYGRENVPGTGALLIASNHASYIDPPLLSFAIKNRFVRYLARDTLFIKPFANWFFRKGGVVPMDRQKGDIGALKLSIQMLKEGDAVGIFPEGTRTEDGNLKQAKGGIGFLINKGGAPVLPVYIKGSFEVFPKGAEKMSRHPIEVYIGKPISPEKLLLKTEKGKVDYDKIGALVMQRIADLIPKQVV